MSNAQPKTPAKPTTPPPLEQPATPPPPDDAELHAHEQANEDAGSSWKTIDNDELKTREARGDQPKPT